MQNNGEALPNSGDEPQIAPPDCYPLHTAYRLPSGSPQTHEKFDQVCVLIRLKEHAKTMGNPQKRV
jgi:hypothetical protein